MIVLKYSRIHFSPLKAMQALLCLRTLVKGIKKALDELHSLGLAHNDVRLANICFDLSFEAVLIDMDRCYPIAMLHPMFTGSVSTSSCMYTMQSELQLGSETDYLQLGWLVAWVLDSSGGDYHKRDWKSQKKEVKDDAFISSLVLKGKYQSQLLEESLVRDTQTLAAVLQEEK